MVSAAEPAVSKVSQTGQTSFRGQVAGPKGSRALRLVERRPAVTDSCPRTRWTMIPTDGSMERAMAGATFATMGATFLTVSKGRRRNPPPRIARARVA